MSRKEAPRAGLVKAALAGRITNAQGAQALGMSLRQFRRLKARYREAGVRGLVHRLRGRPSPRAVDIALRERVLELVDTTYRDLNDCHATEKLREVEGLVISRSTVRRLRRGRGRAPKRRRPPRSTAPAAPAGRPWGPRPHRRQRVRLARHRDAPIPARRHRRCHGDGPRAPLPARGGSARLSHPPPPPRRARRPAGEPLWRSPRRLRPQ